MKKIILVLVVFLAAAPAMAVHTNVVATATQVGSTDEVDIIVTWSGGGSPPRAFAIDVNVGSGQTITEVSGYHVGESETGNKGFGIFPASFNREIDADDPNWAEPNYTPVAHPCDLPGDTLGGIGTSGVTLELGSLFTGPNRPTSPSTLARIKLSGSCTLCLATNVGRGKIVLEDGNEPNDLSMPCVAVSFCVVPNVVNLPFATAQADILTAGFTNGSMTWAGHDTIAAGNVISSTPSAGATPGCGTAVDILVSSGPCLVPNVLDMNETAANAAITAVGFTPNTSSYDCNNSEAAGEVLTQSPAAGSTPGCGTTVNITVSTGPCDPNIGTCWDNSNQCKAQYAVDGAGALATGLGGDSDCDGDVDFADLAAFKRSIWGVKGVTVPEICDLVTPNVYCCCTDFNHDGNVNFADLAILKVSIFSVSGKVPSTSNQSCP